MYTHLEDKLEVAIRNAKKLSGISCNDISVRSNPCTKVYLLIEEKHNYILHIFFRDHKKQVINSHLNLRNVQLLLEDLVQEFPDNLKFQEQLNATNSEIDDL